MPKQSRFLSAANAAFTSTNYTRGNRVPGALYKSQSVFWRTVNVQGHRCKVPIPTTSLNYCVDPKVPSYKLPKGKYLIDTWAKRRGPGAGEPHTKRMYRKYGNSKSGGQHTAAELINRVLRLPGGHTYGSGKFGGVKASWKRRANVGLGAPRFGGGRGPAAKSIAWASPNAPTGPRGSGFGSRASFLSRGGGGGIGASRRPADLISTSFADNDMDVGDEPDEELMQRSSRRR